MRQKVQIGIVIIIILAFLTGIYAFMPQNKEIEMSGFTLEVPKSSAQVVNKTTNYNTYTDTEHDLDIKTWTCKDINDINGTVNASIEMGTQLGENMGTNTTYQNITVLNKSGTYTYFESDTENGCIILITSKNLDTIEHIIKTMKKPKANTENPFNMTSDGLNITNSDNNTTNNNQTAPTKKTNNDNKKTDSETIHISGDPEANGEYTGVGEGIYRNNKNGKVYTQKGRNKLVRSPELDHSPYLAE